MYKMGDIGVCTTVTDGERVDCLAVVWQQSSVWVGQADGTSNVPIVCHFGNVLLCTTFSDQNLKISQAPHVTPDKS